MMNNFYTLIYIEKELNDKLKNTCFHFSVTTFKNVLETYFIAGSSEFRLVFSSDPTSTAIFLDDYRPPKKSNTVSFFEPLNDLELKDIELMDHDRLINLKFSDKLSLRFLLFGNNPNAYLVNKENEIVDAFKDPDYWKNRQAPLPKPPESSREPGPDMKTKNKITTINPQLPRSLIKPLIRQHNLDEKSISDLKIFVQHITTILLDNPFPRVLENGEVCLWQENIVDIPTQKSFETVNECVKYAYREGMYLRRLAKEKGDTTSFLEEQFKNHLKLKKDLEDSDKSLERAENYKKTGHILMSYAHEGKPDSTRIEVNNIYNPGISVSVDVNPDLTFAENAQEFYKKAESSKEDYRQSLLRLEKTKKKLKLIQQLKASLEPLENIKDILRWKKKNQKELESLGWGAQEVDRTNPFKTFNIEGYPLWVGKNAKNNDLLTSSAHKEDIWLHARGVPGSHVVLRMNNSKEIPQKKIILKAASIAAYYSKSRGSEWVPVMYTKKKYVRKPKGSPPGAVLAEREQVEMVPPKSPKQLRLNESQ